MEKLLKISVLLTAGFLFLGADTGDADSATSSAAGAVVQVSADHYRIFYEGTEQAGQAFSLKMEACLNLYNSVLHFDLGKLNVKLKVRIFQNKNGFDAYLKTVIKETKDDFVYIHYSDLGKSELVGFLKPNDADFNTALLHQGFVQFLKAYASNPPVWLQEGLAAFFEQAQYQTDNKKYLLPAELVWLTSLKKIVKGTSEQPLISFDTFLTLDKTSAQMQLATFYPQSWGLVFFLLNSPDRNINRILWDSIAAIDPALGTAENSKRVKDKAFAWFGVAKLENAFKDYFLNLKTLSDLIAEGVTFYSNNELDKAKDTFSLARQRNSDNYIPYYYLGLISYNKKDYSNAESLYLQAKTLKAPAALISYAMGVNAYADNNFDKAQLYLNAAKKQDPQNYSAKVDQILADIGSDTTVPVSTPAPTVKPAPTPAPTATPEPTSTPLLIP